jgi:hypothetical protein
LLTRQVRQKLIDGDEVGSRSTAEMKMLRAAWFGQPLRRPRRSCAILAQHIEG